MITRGIRSAWQGARLLRQTNRPPVDNQQQTKDQNKQVDQHLPDTAPRSPRVQGLYCYADPWQAPARPVAGFNRASDRTNLSARQRRPPPPPRKLPPPPPREPPPEDIRGPLPPEKPPPLRKALLLPPLLNDGLMLGRLALAMLLPAI